MAKIDVQGTEITVVSINENDYLSLTDMLKAKDGDFFISDWLRKRNTVEYLGIWERIHNPDFNYGEFAIIRNQVGLNSYKINVPHARGDEPLSAAGRSRAESRRIAREGKEIALQRRRAKI